MPGHESKQRFEVSFVHRASRAQEMMRRDEPAKAIAILETLIEQQPDNRVVISNLATAYRRDGDADAAYWVLRRAIKSDPDYYPFRVGIADSYRERGDFDAALMHIDHALKLEPELAMLHSKRGLLLNEQGKPDAALEAFDVAIRYDPRSREAFMYAGQVEARLGRWPQAIRRYEEVVRLDPSYTPGYLNLSAALAFAKRFEEGSQGPGAGAANRHPCARGGVRPWQVGGNGTKIELMRSVVGACGFSLLLSGCAEDDMSTDGTGQVPTPWFEEQAAQRGLVFQYQSGQSEGYLFPEIMGGGAALADLDNDGDLDVYLVQGGELFADNSPGNKLFLNVGAGRFEEVRGGGGAADTGYGMGVATGDYDNDGDVDLYVTNFGANVLLRNNGAGEFEDVSEIAGVADPGLGNGGAVPRSGFGRGPRPVRGQLCRLAAVHGKAVFQRETALADYCSPNHYDAPAPDRLYRNNGDGTFTDVSEHAGLGAAFGNGLGVVGTDVDGDGLFDIFVSNDAMMDQLWLNRGNLRFEDEAELWGCAVDQHGVAKAGMGVATADRDNDGDPDILVVNLGGETDSFFQNTGSYFEDVTVSVGLATDSKRYTRFGVAMADFDNDAALDLFEANGAVSRSNQENIAAGYAEPNLLWRGGARFELVDPPGGTIQPLTHTSRGLAVGDVDNDGGLDLLIVNRDGPVSLLMNQVDDRGHWIGFAALNDEGSSVHGAVVSGVIGPTKVYRAAQPAGSYLAASDPRVHFGLGSETRMKDVVVRWPDGNRESFGDFDAGQWVDLRKGLGAFLEPGT